MSASFLSFYHAKFTCKLIPHVHAYSPRGAHRTCVNDLLKSALWSWGRIGFWEALFTRLLPTSTMGRLPSKLDGVLYRHVHPSPAASSFFSTAHRRLCTTTNHGISVYKISMLSFALIMFMLLCATSMLGLCMLVCEITMIYVLDLIMNTYWLNILSQLSVLIIN